MTQANKKDERGQTALHVAAENGNLDDVEKLIAKAAKVDSIDKGQRHTNVVDFLITKGANVNSEDHIQQTPLLAAMNGTKDVAERLISNGAKVDVKDYYKRTALHYAARNGNKEVAKLLIKALPLNVDEKDCYKMTALHYAAENGREDVAKLLIDEGADLNARDDYNRTPLSFADKYSNVKHLFSPNFLFLVVNVSGAPFGDSNDDHSESSPTFIPIKDRVKGINDLSKNSKWPIVHPSKPDPPKKYAKPVMMNLDSQTVKGRSTVSEAENQVGKLDSHAKHNSEATASHPNRSGKPHGKSIIMNPAFQNVNAISTAPKPEPTNSVKRLNDHNGVTGELIDNQADVNFGNNLKPTPHQHYATMNDHNGVAGEFTDSEGDDNIGDGYGQKNVAEMLIKNGADVNGRNHMNLTPLHVAASKGNPFSGHKNVAKLLMSKGADVNVGNHLKMTPLHVAAENGRKKVAEELIKNGADVNSHKDVAKLLMYKGANVNAGKHSKVTPLHLAAQNGHKDVAKLLIEKGANGFTDHSKVTPLHLAAEHGNINSNMKTSTIPILVSKPV
ncbi:ankyrin-3-like [Sitodiplosis mosellana]|uniref:ankyrin-3-like n=1 Tax=Sitodiplosis mosellana TaxID=263140 RepID=UPI002443FFDF|nr:ankyrin-3-like [Sitodiplosis mosellana]